MTTNHPQKLKFVDFESLKTQAAPIGNEIVSEDVFFYSSAMVDGGPPWHDILIKSVVVACQMSKYLRNLVRFSVRSQTNVNCLCKAFNWTRIILAFQLLSE